jgi:hypothetical protein
VATFQEIFEREHLVRLLSKVVAQKIQEEGYSLTDEQLGAIREQVRNAKGETISVDLPGVDIGPNVSVEEEDVARILNEQANKLPDQIQRASKDVAELLLAELRAKAPEMLAEHKEFRNGFEQSVREKWGEALNLFEMFVVIATEAGEAFNADIRPEASSSNDLTFEVLIRLHARCCQIANEVLTLLRSGYPDAAFTRWRTMHEATAVGLFVRKFGQDTAERYLLHEAVESYRAAQQYQRHYIQLGYEPLTDQELLRSRSLYQRLVARYGKPYATSYGWAAHALGNPKPNFSDIEWALSLDHWRPHYKLAGHNIHANPKGVFFKLGLYPERQEVLLVGPSDTGFTDPAHSAAISLMQITTSLLALRPNIDRLAVCHILSTLAEKIGDTFLAIQKRGEETSQL